MLAYIKGTVGPATAQSVVLENQGIGFLIHVSPATLSRLPRTGETAQLYTHLQVKEDDLSLHGFLTQEELALFKLLISVSGVGPKVASGLLSVLSPAQIITAIAAEDAAALSKAPGVGRKTAQRIALDLQGKIQSPESLDWAAASDFGPGALAADASQKQDAIEALLALGYSRSDSLRAALEVATEDMPAQQIIRLALKRLGRA